MSIEGVALVHTGSIYWRQTGAFDREPTHRAFPEPVASALVTVAEAAREIGTLPPPWAVLSGELVRALAALDVLAEAQAGAA